MFIFIKNFFTKTFLCIKKSIKDVGAKAKAILLGIGAVIGFIIFAFLNFRKNEKELLEIQLKRAKSEVNIEKSKVRLEINEDRLEELSKIEEDIKRKIWDLDQEGPSEEVSLEELDKFFDERGF